MRTASQSGLVIVGAGPAGLAPLFAAATAGNLQQILQRGVTILERGPTLGSGALSGYAIRSDSAAEAFLDIVVHSAEPALASLRTHPLTLELIALGKSAAPLPLVAGFLQLAGETLCALVSASERGQVLLGHEAVSVAQAGGGRWMTRYRDLASGAESTILSSSVVLALGAHQPLERLYAEAVAGEPLLPRHKSKLMQSGAVLSRNGLAEVTQRLHGCASPKIVIVGGSTSAGAVAARLLGEGSPFRFGPGDLTLLHRRPLRIFYESREAACAEGYTEFADTDICRLTGRVYRFSGFRLDSRELMMSARGIGNRPREPRLRLLRLSSASEAEAREILDKAHLVIAAMGYRPGALPVLDEGARPVPLAVPEAGSWSVVDQQCRLKTSAGVALDNLFAIGLAVGPAPGPDLGGEIDFHGQVNSLWMWQHTLGRRIVEGVLASHELTPCMQPDRPKQQIVAVRPNFEAVSSALLWAEGAL